MLRAFVNCAMVLTKRLNFFYFQWPKVDQVRSEYLRSYLNWLHNWQLKNRRHSHTLKGSHSMGDRRIFLKKPAATLPLIKIYRMSLISTGSISLDSTFKESGPIFIIWHCFWFTLKCQNSEFCHNFTRNSQSFSGAPSVQNAEKNSANF